MKKLMFIATLTAVLLYCRGDYKLLQTYKPKPKPQRTEQSEIENASLEKAVNETDPKIKIASFNIQVFGKSKREKEDVMQVLEKIVRNFDIVAVQEIKDRTLQTLPYFIGRINAIGGDRYDGVASARLGRQYHIERYAFIYNTKTIRFRNISYVYNDSSDVFAREPFIASFSSVSGNFDFTLVNIHTKPKDATKEIQALVDVVKDADKRVSDDKDVIVLGDYNADGRDFSETITTGFRAPIYYWVIPDTADTTTKATVYTYDRIVFRKQFTSEDFAGKFGVFDFKRRYGLTQKLTEKVSDHFPVWGLFYTNRDSD